MKFEKKNPSEKYVSVYHEVNEKDKYLQIRERIQSNHTNGSTNRRRIIEEIKKGKHISLKIFILSCKALIMVMPIFSVGDGYMFAEIVIILGKQNCLISSEFIKCKYIFNLRHQSANIGQ